MVTPVCTCAAQKDMNWDGDKNAILSSMDTWCKQADDKAATLLCGARKQYKFLYNSVSEVFAVVLTSAS